MGGLSVLMRGCPCTDLKGSPRTYFSFTISDFLNIFDELTSSKIKRWSRELFTQSLCIALPLLKIFAIVPFRATFLESRTVFRRLTLLILAILRAKLIKLKFDELYIGIFSLFFSFLCSTEFVSTNIAFFHPIFSRKWWNPHLLFHWKHWGVVTVAKQLGPLFRNFIQSDFDNSIICYQGHDIICNI